MSSPKAQPRPSASEMRTLIAEAREGGLEQRAKVLEVFRPYLVVRSFTKLDPRVQAKCAPSDAAAETIVKAMNGFSGFHGATPDSLMAWLDTINANCIRDTHRQFILAERRSVAREEALASCDSREFLNNLANAVAKDASPSQELTQKEFAERVSEAFQSLSSRQREVLELRFIKGLPFKDVGHKLGIQSSAAREASIRGLAKLARLLSKENEP